MRWRYRGRFAGLLLLSLSFIAANSGYSIGPAQAGSGDPSTEQETLNQKMIAAQSEAQGHFDLFLNFILDDTGMARPDAGVKVVVPHGDGAHSLVWLNSVAERDGQFVGHFTDASEAIKMYRVGDEIKFERTQVRDWYFHGRTGLVYGAYTTRAVLGDRPAETAARMGLLLAETPLPTNW